MTQFSQLPANTTHFLSKIEIFQGLDSSLLSELSETMQILSLNHGEILMQQGETGDCLFIVIDGRLRVLHQQGKEHSPTVICEIGRGESVGEMAIVTGEMRTATVVAIRRSIVMQLTREQFDQLIERHPHMVMKIARAILTRSLLTDSSRENITSIALVPLSKNVHLIDFANDLTSVFNQSQATLLVNSQWVDQKIGKPVSQSQPDSSDDLQIVNWLTEQTKHFPLMIYAADAEETEWTHRCLRQADRILLVANADDPPIPGELESRLFGGRNKVTDALTDLVLLHQDRSRRPERTIEWFKNRNIHRHHHVAVNHLPDYQRLARIITDQAISLVLSGGGARGFAHIGVMKAFRESGVPVDVIGGVSMGAIMATICAMELDSIKMIKEPKAFCEEVGRGAFTFPMLSLFSDQKLNRFLRKGCMGFNIEDMWINYFCLSTDLNTAESVVHNRGPLWKAIRASSSIPGVFAPIVNGNHWLVDGGTLNNLPVDIMSQIYSGKIIAVDTTSQANFIYKDHHLAKVSGWKLLWKKLNPFAKFPDIPNIANIFIRSSEVAAVQLRDFILANHPPHLYIRLPVEEFGMLDYKAYDAIVEKGYQYARTHMDTWKKRLDL